VWDLDELNGHRDIIAQIDWEMTPETAVETYLEWGTGWSRKGDFVQYRAQESLYFAIYDWEKPPQVTLIRRTMRDMEELAKIEAPEQLIRQAVDEGGHKPGVGVVAITEALREWLQRELGC